MQGGHIDVCDQCASVRISYNSCRNRHCPKCGGIKKDEWIEARQSELLPVDYYHLVFTVPEQLNGWMMYNERLMYDVLFASAWQTIQTLAADHRYLGANTGMVAILHTWGQQLSFHPHLHCIVAGGGITRQGKWRRAKRTTGKFLFPVKAMSKIFKNKFLDMLKGLQCSLQYPPDAMPLDKTIKALYLKDWVVYARRSFGGPAQVVAYLGRYTHKVAISNQRLKGIENQYVHFSYKDYRSGDMTKQMRLTGEEFIRRWLMHILPHRYVKIRHYGFLCNRGRTKRLQQIASGLRFKLLPPLIALDYRLRLKLFYGVDPDRCPHCGNGKMVTVRILERTRSP